MKATYESGSILLVASSFDRDGGVASHVKDSAVALGHAGFDVSVAAARRGESAPAGVTFHAVPGLDVDPQGDVVRETLADLAGRLRPDIVHFHDLADPALVESARGAAPTVASVHGYAGCTPNTYYFQPGHECRRGHGPGCLANMTFRGCAHSRNPRGRLKGYRATTRRLQALRLSDQTVVYSRAVARNLERNEIHRCTVVPLFTSPVEAAVPPPEDRRVLFAGRVVGAKGLGVLLEAADGLDCTVEVYGDGWWLPRARKQVGRAGIADRVVFHGWTDEPTLARGYADCRIVAVPSLWPEPFGLVGIEAMAHSRPVVATDTGGVREWLVDGETGSLVPPGDPDALRATLDRMLNDYELCARMGRAGAARGAELFSPTAHVAALNRVYQSARERWSQAT